MNTNRQNRTLDELKERRVSDAPAAEYKKNEYKMKSIDSTKYTFSSKGFYSYQTICYVLQEFALSQKHLITFRKYSSEYEYDYKTYKEIISTGNVVFEYENNLYSITMDGEDCTVLLTSNVDVSNLVKILKKTIRYENPLRGKLFQIKQGNNGFFPIMKQVPNITFNDVILDDKLKEDIYDNTIFQLENLNENNGIILYGEPGVGKSHICSAIARECISKKHTVCYLSTAVDYTMLNEFLESFVSPCILIFEDIDVFGQDRELNGGNPVLADFLQFINGISEKEERVIFIATTNCLDKLDKAIANRPVRFNRKFEFNYPTSGQINKLIKLYFDDEISNKFSHLCYNKNFSGSHIKELQRTVNLLTKKRNTSVDSVFEESVNLVKQNFSPKLTSMGFNL